MSREASEEPVPSKELEQFGQQGPNEEPGLRPPKSMLGSLAEEIQDDIDYDNFLAQQEPAKHGWRSMAEYLLHRANILDFPGDPFLTDPSPDDLLDLTGRARSVTARQLVPDYNVLVRASTSMTDEQRKEYQFWTVYILAEALIEMPDRDDYRKALVRRLGKQGAQSYLDKVKYYRARLTRVVDAWRARGVL